MVEEDLMTEFVDSVEFVGNQRSWQDVPETAETDEDKLGFFERLKRVLGVSRNAGGAGSGDYGHAGRPGQVGGSGEGIRNISISSSGQGKIEDIFGMDQDTLVAHLVHGTHSTEIKVEIHASKKEGHIIIDAKTGDQVDYHLEVLRRDTVRGSVFEVDKIIVDPHLRTTDAAMKLLDNTITLAEKNGVDTIEFNANIDKGGYAWARMGATTTNSERLAEKVSARLVHAEKGTTPKASSNDEATIIASNESLAGLRTLDSATRNQLLAFIKSNRHDEDLPAKLAELKVDGKKIGSYLLRGISWDGKLNLKDPVAMTRFGKFARRN